ncbi:MAG: glycoside hydrolase family 2 protein [Blautia sp.]|jgi:beta-galactosidase/beta-glucuronidase
MKQLYTKWKAMGEQEIPWKEYPRPQLEREQYEILNGIWDYAITKNEKEPLTYDGKIRVPFSPEAALSGVGKVLLPGEYLHYYRSFPVDGPIEGHLLLHFGAVDERCQVYVNHCLVGSHKGGYLSFTFDITSYIKEGTNELHVVVQDDSDTSYHSRGKQKLKRGGMFYQAQSGIWQTVWMETVPEDYVESLRMIPCYDEAALEVKVFSNGRKHLPVTACIYDGDDLLKEVTFTSDEKAMVEMKDFHAWSPEDPHLYWISFTMGEDQVKSYFAMRKYSLGVDQNGIKRFFLNDEPYFHNGLLDQGYWPEGLLTAPCDEALVYDIQKMKDLGFNMLRKHVKIEPERWYYHCDRLGMLVWQDMINGGSTYHMKFICVLPNALMWSGRCIKDDKYRAFARQDEAGRKEYYQELKGMLRQLYNIPSIAAWVPFNEGWGQFDAAKATDLVEKLDPTRFIDEASGWFDQKGGDMYSIHNYWRPLKVAPKDRVVALTEYGGYSYRMPEHSYCEEIYGYKDYKSCEELTEGFRGLIERDILPNISKGLSATVYTQVSDVEEEVNGIFTYDREYVKLTEDVVRELNRKIYEEFDRCVKI